MVLMHSLSRIMVYAFHMKARTLLAILLVAGATGASAASITLTNNDAFNFTSFDTGLNWNSGLAPTNGNDYFISTFALRTPTNTGDYTFQGDSLTIDNGGLLNMKGTGVITITNLNLNGGRIGNGIDAIVTLNGNINVTAASTFDTQTAGRTIVVNSAISGNGPLSFILGGLTRLNASNSFTGGITIDTGAVAVTNNFNLGAAGSGITFTNGGTLQLTNNFTLSNRALTLNDGGGALQVSSNSTIIITNVINGVGGLTKTGAGTLTLSGANNYTGSTVVSNGFVVLANSSALGATNGGTTVIGSGGTTGSRLILTNGVTIADALTLVSTGTDRVRIVSNGGTNTLSGPISISSPGAVNVTFDAENGSSMIISGDITGTGSFGVRGSASGTLTGNVNVSGDFFKTDGSTWTIGAPGKTYSWIGTLVAAGTIKLGTDNVLPAATLLTIGQAGTNNATFNLNGFNQTVGGLATTGIGNLIITNSGALATLTVSNAATRTFAGRIGGALALTKTGAALLTLTGSNTYTGVTTINDGTLSINGLGLNSAITVAGGAIGGTGVVGNVTINSGGRLSPGNSIGTLTVSNLTLDTGALLAFELGATNNSDKVLALGTLTLNNQDFSSFTFSTNAGFGIGLYTLIDATATNGTFTEISTNNFFGYSATLSVGGADGKDLTLNVVPEPGAGALVGAGLLAMLLLRRWRRR